MNRSVGKQRVIFFQSMVALWVGAFLLFFPGATFRTFVLIVCLYLIFDGGLTLLSKTGEESKIPVALGAIAVLIGIIAWVNPRLLGFKLIFILAAWALIHGLIFLADLVSSRYNKQLALWLGLSGLSLFALAFWMFGHTNSTPFFLIRWIGIFGVVYGYALLGLGYELKRDSEQKKAQGDRALESKKVA